MGKPSTFLIISVLLVAPSGSLAGPVPSPELAHQAVVLPWGQQVGQVGAPGGFIYCAGCSPINPQQLVLPSNAPVTKGIPLISASGVLPPGHNPQVKQINALGKSGEEPGKGQKIWDDGSVPVQQMALHDDGRYSFSYNTADSARQEERNLDGSVSGSYSYTDPTGKLVQIDYVAGPQGYNAYGENVPQAPVFQLPQPVRDTPEVQEARERFLQAYASELARHQQESDTAHGSSSSTVAPEGPSAIVEDAEATTMTPGESNDDGDAVVPAASENEGETVNADDAVVVSGKSEPGQDDEDQGKAHDGEMVDDDTDSVVISADEPVNNQNQANVNHPDPSYQITIPIGVGQNAGLSVQMGGPQGGQKSAEAQPMPVMQDGQNQLKSNLQPYFYYVSVGGSPHYVTAPSIPGYNSPYPTSLKATLLNSLPLAAVHDAQIPNRGNNDMNTNLNSIAQGVNRPIFLDLGNNVGENKPVPQNQNDQMQMQWQSPQQFPSSHQQQMQNMQTWQQQLNNQHQLVQQHQLNNQQQLHQQQLQHQQQMQQWQVAQQQQQLNNQLPQQQLNNQQQMQMQQWQYPQQQLDNQQQMQFPQQQQLNNQQQMQMQQWQLPQQQFNQQQMQQQNPSLMNNNNNNNNNQNQLSFNNPLYGQLVPIQLAPLGSHNNGLTFGYIPGLILSNGGAVSTPTQPQNEGSQSNMQVPALSVNLPQQQQQQDQVEQVQAPTSAPASDEPQIVLASKK